MQNRDGRQGGDRSIPITLGIIGLTALVVTLLAVRPNATVTTQPTVPGKALVPANTGSELGAVTACEGFMKQRLKAPATAKYSGWLDSSTTPAVDGSTIVNAYVDAQNSFGALIRTRYLCRVSPDSGGNWRLLDFREMNW